jgi:small subunit ribosomal protein S3
MGKVWIMKGEVYGREIRFGMDKTTGAGGKSGDSPRGDRKPLIKVETRRS